jgi:23S rRNA pseudouridine2605 synthase
MSEERLQKILARAGIASRRKAEELIREGRVTVNGQVADIGAKADLERDAVKLDERRILLPTSHRYLLLNKPRGVMSTVSDPGGRPTVIDLVPPALRRALAPVGRLDFLTEGLLLLTDDGELAQQVAHPRHGCWKTYEVKVKGRPEAELIERLRGGIVLEGRRTAPCRISARDMRPVTRRGARGSHGKRAGDGDNSWWLVELGEGRTRQIREMFQRIGHPVQKLRRVAIGPVSDPDLPLGAVRELSEREVALLRKSTPPPPPAPSPSASASRSPGSSRPSTPARPTTTAKAEGDPHRPASRAPAAARARGRAPAPRQSGPRGTGGGPRHRPGAAAQRGPLPGPRKAGPSGGGGRGAGHGTGRPGPGGGARRAAGPKTAGQRGSGPGRFSAKISAPRGAEIKGAGPGAARPRGAGARTGGAGKRGAGAAPRSAGPRRGGGGAVPRSAGPRRGGGGAAPRSAGPRRGGPGPRAGAPRPRSAGSRSGGAGSGRSGPRGGSRGAPPRRGGR